MDIGIVPVVELPGFRQDLRATCMVPSSSELTPPYTILAADWLPVFSKKVKNSAQEVPSGAPTPPKILSGARDTASRARAGPCSPYRSLGDVHLDVGGAADTLTATHHGHGVVAELKQTIGHRERRSRAGVLRQIDGPGIDTC